jgi:hypothetical protein
LDWKELAFDRHFIMAWMDGVGGGVLFNKIVLFFVNLFGLRDLKEYFIVYIDIILGRHSFGDVTMYERD